MKAIFGSRHSRLCLLTPDAHPKVLLTKSNGATLRQRAKWAQIDTGRVKGLVSEHRAVCDRQS
jgi:hypothetical protein